MCTEDTITKCSKTVLMKHFTTQFAENGLTMSRGPNKFHLDTTKLVSLLSEILFKKFKNKTEKLLFKDVPKKIGETLTRATDWDTRKRNSTGTLQENASGTGQKRRKSKNETDAKEKENNDGNDKEN